MFLSAGCSRDAFCVFAPRCLTLPGAGESLQWTVTVDGQVSELSSTDYAPPVISALSGPGAVNASVYGNQEVVITGNYFGPRTDVYGVKFLQSVTYGPTGVEYTAKDCAVEDDSTILCKTTQGVGQNLRWLVTVEGQMSQLSQATTSYAKPELLSAEPLVGHTSGGALITLKGRNLATFNDPKTYFDGQEMATSYTIGQDTIFATVPEGWGRHKEIYIEVGGSRTTSVFFNYFDPHIDTVNAKPVEGSNGAWSDCGNETVPTDSDVCWLLPLLLCCCSVRRHVPGGGGGHVVQRRPEAVPDPEGRRAGAADQLPGEGPPHSGLRDHGRERRGADRAQRRDLLERGVLRLQRADGRAGAPGHWRSSDGRWRGLGDCGARPGHGDRRRVGDRRRSPLRCKSL